MHDQEVLEVLALPVILQHQKDQEDHKGLVLLVIQHLQSHHVVQGHLLVHVHHPRHPYHHYLEVPEVPEILEVQEVQVVRNLDL